MFRIFFIRPQKKDVLKMGILTGLLVVVLPSCSTVSPYPKELEPQIDHTLSYTELKSDPSVHKGKTVLMGGVVLSPKTTDNGTRLEILQLPLASDYEPAGDRMATEGRFLALNSTFLDPAVVPAGSRVTIVGEVTDPMTLPLDETTYTYPTLLIKHLKLWSVPSDSSHWNSRPFFGPYYGWGPFWGPYYRWNPYFGHRGFFRCGGPYPCW